MASHGEKARPFGVGIGPDFADVPGLRIWLTQPLGMITQVDLGAMLSGAMTDLMTGPAYQALRRLAGGDHPFWFVHDFAGIGGYAPEARNALVAWPRNIGKPNIRGMAVCLSEGTTWPVRLAVEFGVGAIRMAGYAIEVNFEPLPTVVARLGLSAHDRPGVTTVA